MMKNLFLCLVISMFSLTTMVLGQEVEISIDHPPRVNAGEAFTVSVTISKGSLTDYSRFSQDLPLGLSATNVSSPNADFSFDNQRIRIIWLKMPESNQITISYKVMVDPRLKGSFVLGGVFAYVVENDRKFLNFDENELITIVPNSSVDPALVVDIRDFKGGEAAPVAARSGEVFAMAVRQKPELLNNGGYLVRLLVNNPSGSKYAKIEETIPFGYMFEEVNSNEGIVSHAASTVKFIWMKLPQTTEFEVVYRLVPKQNEPQGDMIIDGMLTYTAGNDNKIVEVKEMDVYIQEMTQVQKRNLLAIGTVPARTARSTANVTKPPETVTPRQPAASTSVAGSASGKVIMNTRVLDYGTGAYYRVQLSANRNAVDAVTYYRDAGLDREVLVEQHEGYYKYTVGPFSTYQQAVSYKNQIDGLAEIDGSFVVAYRDGRRVPAGSVW
jgi:hypothetical protein